jgi:hypothetical protein
VFLSTAFLALMGLSLRVIRSAGADRPPLADEIANDDAVGVPFRDWFLLDAPLLEDTTATRRTR